ncbi:MAG TPA: hypothetical protein VKP30_05870 [Polyangiaceae bacterium]|nr:hypothetical protein [Polyangiaceae bacterium]
MKLHVLECPHCGAPLPRRAALVRLNCPYCKSEVVVDRYSVKAAEYRDRLDEYLSENTDQVWRFEQWPIRVLSKVAAGHSTDVYLARRATRITECLIAKVLRLAEDEPLLQNEERVLSDLATSTAKGAPYFTTLLPQRVTRGHVFGPANDTLALVYREATGFRHTLADIAAAYGNALDPRHAVWIGRRTLELLDFVHRCGYVHASVVPAHILIDVRQHGARLVGYSSAARPGTRAVRVDAEYSAIYPGEMLGPRGVRAQDDIAMLARCLGLAIRGHPEKPAALLRCLSELSDCAASIDAWQAQRKIADAARASFGPGRFIELDVP